nr:metalloregulator ArsR/SmtB family transcription factor [uncultured Brevundimonas sp.]
MNTLFKALSHPVRRRIVAMLRTGPLASGDIAAAFDMSWPTITGHLNALKEAGLVSPEREGQTIRYRLEISAIEEAMAFLMDIAGTGEAAALSHADQPRTAQPRTTKAPRR